MDTSNDYYAVLGVDSQANASVIKAAFKKLALQYHPDVNSGADAQERMRGILQAYQTLSDPETRKEYDALRNGKGGNSRGESASRFATRQGSDAGSNGQGRFAFPDLRETPISTLTFSLEHIAYNLSSAQAESLKWDGMLRGNAPVADASACYNCQRCHHRWSARGSGHPTTCPKCSAADWAEYLLLRCIHCQAVFASQELRDPLHGNSLYNPYELFPLCPRCRRSQWCPAEDRRVQHLRTAAKRRALLIWICVIVAFVSLVALAVLLFMR